MRACKAVHLSTIHRPGDMRVFQKTCLSLAAAGYEVVLVIPHDRDEMVNGVRIRCLRKPANRFHRMTRTANEAIRVCLEEHPDVVHIHDPMLLPRIPYLHRRGLHVIFDMHENMPTMITTKLFIPRPLRSVFRAIYRFMEKRWLRDAAVIFAEFSYKQDYPWVKRSVTVLNMPRVEQLLAINEEKAEPPAVGYMGGVSVYRVNLRTLEALQLVQQQDVDVAFECVGPATAGHEDVLNEHISRYKLRGVHMYGYMPPMEGYRIMARCRIGLAVLDNHPNLRDSYPTKIFEYMALGLPVIASDFPLYRSVVEGARCGLCVNPEDPKSLATAIKLLIEDPGQAEEMGKRGRQAVEQCYRWETEEAKLLKLYEELIQRKK